MKKYLLLLLLLINNHFIIANPEWLIYDTRNFYFSDDVNECAFDKYGNTWIVASKNVAGLRGGIGMFDGSKWTSWFSDSIGLSSSNFNSIAIDKKSNIWIGMDIGLLKYDHNNFMLFDSTNSPLHSWIDVVVDSNNIKWMAYSGYGFGQGLASFDDKDWKLYDSSNTPIPPGQLFYKIFVDSKNNKWVTLVFDGPIFYYDNNKWEVYDSLFNYYPFGDTEGFAEDSLGNIWLAWVYPVKFDGTDWTIYKDCPGETIRAVAVENKNTLWFSGGGGLIKFEDSQWTFWNSSNSPIKGVFGNISIDQYGNKWLSSYLGLYVFNEGGVKGITDIKDDQNVEENKILCYPNPSPGTINIRYRIESPGIITLTLSDALGNLKILKREYKYPGDYVEDFDFKGNPQGLYNVILQQGNTVNSEKIIIVK